MRDDRAPMVAPTRKDPTKLTVKSNAPQTNVDTTSGLFDDAALLSTLYKSCVVSGIQLEKILMVCS